MTAGVTHHGNLVVAGTLIVGSLNGPGRTFFVDKDNGNNGNTGESWDEAHKTIQFAVNRCRDGRHDVVLVATAATAYAENVVVTSKSYVSIIGVGRSDWGRPDIHPTAGVALTVTGSVGFHAQNVFFLSDDDNAVVVDSNGWKFENCRFLASTHGLSLLPDGAVGDNGASQGEAIGCMFWECSTAGVLITHADSPSGIAVSDCKFKDCIFKDNGIDFLSAVGASGGGAGIFINFLIENCKFMTTGAAYVYMDMDQGIAADLAANSILIAANYFSDEALVAAQVDVSGQPKCMVVGNYDTAGLVDGATFND